MAERDRKYEQRLRDREGLSELAVRFLSDHGSTVLHGPFRGLRYPPALLMKQADSPIAKLLGTYEEELHAVFEDVIDKQNSPIVDIGATDGYYAVGLASRCRNSTIHTFEIASSGRRCCRELADANGVQINLRGKATSKCVRSLPLNGAFVLCDIEGAEAVVLDESAVQALRTAVVVVELHEQHVPGITNVLRNRFSEHDCSIINSSSRSLDLPELATFTLKERELAVSEWRSQPMSWAVFRPAQQI